MKPSAAIMLVSAGGLALMTFASASQAAPAARSAIDPGHIGGVWISSRFSADRDQERSPVRNADARDLQAASGRMPPLASWVRDVLAQRAAAEKTGRPIPNPKALCLPAGTPQSMFPPAALPIQILVTRDQVTVLFEEFSYFRIIRMNEKHPADPDPSYFGDSVGHWEGDTLVVDTIGVSTKTTIGATGVPHTADLHVVERIRRVGDGLEDEITLTDPKSFTGPWVMRSSFKSEPGLKLAEYYCVNDRNAPDASGRTSIQAPGR